MKKHVLVYGVIILVVLGLAVAGYWYAQNQPEEVEPLQQVALDNPEIDSFDDVCTKKDEHELECTGNIEEFGCDRYRNVGVTFKDLNPSYPMLVCEKKTSSKNEVQKDEGIYRQNAPTGYDYSAANVIDYFIIKDDSFQLVKSEDQFRQLFQPVASTDEAKAYFIGLNKASLLLGDEQLSRIKSAEAYGGQQAGSFTVPLDSIGLSEVAEVWNGYTMTAYSSLGGDCVTEIYQYKYLLKKDGHLVEKNKQLIWESKFKPRCIN